MGAAATAGFCSGCARTHPESVAEARAAARAPLVAEAIALGVEDPAALFKLGELDLKSDATHPAEYLAFLHKLLDRLRAAPAYRAVRDAFDDRAVRDAFDERVRGPGLRAAAVKFDGNCLFHAASLIAYGAEVHHAELRAAATAFLRATPPLPELTLSAAERGLPVAEQLDRLATDRVHVGAECLLALGRVLGRNARAIVCSAVSATPMELAIGSQEEGAPLLCVSNFGGTSHYNAAVPPDAPPSVAFDQAELDRAVAAAVQRALH